ncbi:hypothetical protein Tco_0703074 [Tanacetum coccineum]|uniref:Uncharacterized protein n=1 Tax=Tanacetum coccineum TaxID=301880 RepID=A0ABQ4XZN9_9ASTR
MSVHNSENGDDYVKDNVTLIRSNTNEVLGKQWDKVNAIFLGWILNSIPEELFLGQTFSKRAKDVWKELKETYDKVDGSIMFGLHHQINTLKQNGSSIADYYHKLNALWKQFDAMIELPKCVCNASESSILSREVLHDVRSAYATISSEESHRVAAGSVRNNQNTSNGTLRFNNLNNNRQGGGSTLVCENCGFNGYTIDRCFKIIRYPADFGKKKSGANQDMTYTDKELDNVLDISHLKIKVGHPNRIEAFISKIGNLKLSNGLILYDVMVIPEYCVTLISVHKLDKENKVIVAFDENRCIKSNNSALRYQCFLSQYDWHCRLGHPAESVLNVLKESLQIDNKENNVFCEIYIPNDDERVDNNLNRDQKSQSDSSIFSMPNSNVNTTDFPIDNSKNDVDSSDDIVAAQNEEVATLEENVFSEGNLDQNPSTSQGVQNVRREPKSYFEASKYPHWTDAMNQEMDALLRNGTWEVVELLRVEKP